MLEKNILGTWGAHLSDGDYACALAALGALQTTTMPSGAIPPNPDAIATALRAQMISGERTIVWQVKLPMSGALHFDAAALAQGWRDFRHNLYHLRDMPRMAVPLEMCLQPDFPFQALREWLAHEDVVLGSMMLEALVANGPSRIGWHWPLRVGFVVGGGPALRIAFDKARGIDTWITDLVQAYPVGEARDRCDLLIVDATDTSILRAPGRLRIRASCVVILDDPPALDRAAEFHAHLTARFGAASVAWVGQSKSLPTLADWLTAVFREISHDVPMPTTLAHAAHKDSGIPPLILGRAHLVDRCRILAIADHQDRVIASLNANSEFEPVERGSPVPRQPINYEPKPDPSGGPGPRPIPGLGEGVSRGGGFRSAPSEPTFGGGPIIEPPPAARPKLPTTYADDLRHRAFTSETVDGKRSKGEMADRDEKIGSSLLPRWIQANAWRQNASANDARSFPAGKWTLLGIHIGPSATPRTDAPFVTTGLDFSQGDLPVVAQVEISGTHVQALSNDDMTPTKLLGANVRNPILKKVAALSTPSRPTDPLELVGLSSATLMLPSTGDSTVALFAVFPVKGANSYSGRISIIYGNRVLQTARLDLETRTGMKLQDAPHVFAEARIHARDDDLEERRTYDVAIGVSDIGGKLHLNIQQGDKAESASLSNLTQPIADIRAALKNIAEKFDYSLPMLGQPAFDVNLYVLAAHGKVIENHLRSICHDAIDDWQRINLVTQTSEFFPLEYLYAGASPDLGAKVCPNMEKSLLAGDCRQALRNDSAGNPGCPHIDDPAYVCPQQFWAFQRTIERSRGRRATENTPASVADSSTVRVPSKQPFGSVSALVFAASERAFAYAQKQDQPAERAQVVAALNALWQPIPSVDDWKQWQAEVSSGSNVIVLIVHTDAYHTVPVLEIGKSQFLPKNKIEQGFLGNSKRPRLLLLLGCSTAGVQDDFQPYPELFHIAGADIVLANVGVVRGQDAVEIVKRLGTQLAARLKGVDAISLGELLPQLRRELLAAGHPGVLGLVGFGDGDWLLGGH